MLVIKSHALVEKDFQVAAAEFFIQWTKNISCYDGKIEEEAKAVAHKTSQKAFLTNKTS